MNKNRRKEIEKAIALLNSAHEILKTESEEEQDYADNMPDNLQYNSEKHERAEEVATQLDTNADSCLELIEELEGVME